MVTQIYKIRSEISVAPSHEISRTKNVKFQHDFRQLRDLIVNISRTQQDIVNPENSMQTTDILTQAYLIWYTLVHKWLKTGPEFWHTHRP